MRFQSFSFSAAPAPLCAAFAEESKDERRILSQDAGRTWKRRKLFNEISLWLKDKSKERFRSLQSCKTICKAGGLLGGWLSVLSVSAIVILRLKGISAGRRTKDQEREPRDERQLLHTLEIKLTFFDPVHFGVPPSPALFTTNCRWQFQVPCSQLPVTSYHLPVASFHLHGEAERSCVRPGGQHTGETLQN